MNRFYRAARFAGASAVLLLAACGSGGSSDLSNAPGISVSPSSLSFSAVHNGLLPPPQVVQVTISASNAAFAGVAVPAANPPPWLDYTKQSPLAGPGTPRTPTAVTLSPSPPFGHPPAT